MKNFKLTELIRCYRDDKAQRCKDCRLTQRTSKLPNGIEENVEALMENVLEPARERLGKAIVVNSGFRCPLHNAAVGGVASSQHVKGEAADVRCEDNHRLARVIVEQGRFDQLIMYPTFLHVSYRRQGGNRHEVLKKVGSGYQKI